MRPALLVAALSVAAPIAAQAQMGELHFGVIGGYGVAASYRGGAGVTIAVVPGRIVFLGLRYVHHWGSSFDTANVTIHPRSETVAADLGFQFPFGNVEVVIGASLGSTHFEQDVPDSTGKTEGWEFLVAPSLTAYFRLGRFLIAPEFQWGLAGDPDLLGPTPHLGPVIYLRLVLPIEIGRIRQ